METLNYFDSIKVSPPMHTNRLADTITQIKEKKEYYQKLSEQAEKDVKSGDKPETKEDPAKKDEGKKSSPKKENKIVSINESDFPSMQWVYIL